METKSQSLKQKQGEVEKSKDDASFEENWSDKDSGDEHQAMKETYSVDADTSMDDASFEEVSSDKDSGDEHQATGETYFKMKMNKVPPLARSFRSYLPIKGYNPVAGKSVKYTAAEMKNETLPVYEKIREHWAVYDEHLRIRPRPSVLDHFSSGAIARSNEGHVHANGWDIKDFKILRIWNTSFNKKPPNLPCSVNCESVSGESVVLNICRHEEDEYESRLTKKKGVELILDAKDCDKQLSVKVNDCEVSYSLYSNAVRVKIEMIPYYTDHSLVPNVHGHVNLKLLFGGDNSNTKILFDEGETHKKAKLTDGAPMFSSIFILPRYRYNVVILDVSLTDALGKLEVKSSARLLFRSVVIDQQHYIFGRGGYIKLRAFWGCSCVDQGVCTCCLSGDVMSWVLEKPEVSNTSCGRVMSKK